MVNSRILKREFPILLATMALGLFLLWDLHLSRLDGFILLGTLLALTVWLVRVGKTTPASEPLTQEVANEIPKLSLGRAGFWTAMGLVLLLISSRILVDGAVSLATIYGVSDLIIGLTIVAIGTSLPELAASIISAIKKEPDIALGNVIGSNMFNLLAVLGIPGVVSPMALEPAMLNRDYAVMLVFTVMLFIFAYGFRGPGRINRIEGGLLLAGYIAYMVVLYLSIAK
jgi:cation:H+ antiporter